MSWLLQLFRGFQIAAISLHCPLNDRSIVVAPPWKFFLFFGRSWHQGLFQQLNLSVFFFSQYWIMSKSRIWIVLVLHIAMLLNFDGASCGKANKGGLFHSPRWPQHLARSYREGRGLITVLVPAHCFQFNPGIRF